jgi:phage-related baseplate assembly protein
MARFNLPDVEFVELDPEQIEAEMINRHFELTGKMLKDADPRKKMYQVFLYGLVLFLNNVEYAVKQRLLSYAEDDFLDHLGEEENVPRLEPTPAKTIERIELNIPQGETVTLPAGTRVAATSEISFATQEDIPIESGTPYIDVEVVCTEPGTIGNGFLPGQINQLVDNNIPWISKVYNITTSEGGTDWEDDDAYAERIRLSKEGYSTAGPEQAYIFHAKSANKLVSDVSVQSPSDGVVEITVLLENGEIPDETILTEVENYLSDKNKRPLTDRVVVVAPEAVEYDINATYYISADKESVLADIQASIEAAKEEYIAWQKQKLGRGIDPGELIALLKKAGAARVEVQSPAGYQAIAANQVAKERNVTLTYGGIINV